jgi:hypothetical protein
MSRTKNLEVAHARISQPAAKSCRGSTVTAFEDADVARPFGDPFSAPLVAGCKLGDARAESGCRETRSGDVSGVPGVAAARGLCTGVPGAVL